MRLDARRTGEAIAAASGELARIWRSARASGGAAQPSPLGGVVERFLGALGEGLAHGRPPQAPWADTQGVVRLPARPGPGGEEALAREWKLLGEVLSAACQTLDADAAATDGVARAVDAAARASETLREGERPAGVFVLWIYP